MHIIDARAVRASIEVVSQVSARDLERPTPCEGWALADLLAHMTVQHDGFAAAARGATDLADWAVRPLGADPVTDYRAAGERVIAAFAEDGVLARRFTLPEVSPTSTFAASTAIGFHFIDYLVHSWDVARTIGITFAPEPDLVAAATPIAESVPDDDRRRQPGSAFAPGLVLPDGASPWDRLLARLGRSPAWSAY
ncbi:TIGR03086 family metal-binding protein [Actinophytocola sp.]|uniref:TIGR03086 family metal-binding protein n=1 Tax=Actinophytocola sp. TaxID=1872138 RepID=UPI002ED28467